MQNIMEQGCHLLGVGAGSVYLLDETKGDLKLVVSRGYTRDYTGTRLAPGEGLAGKVLQSGGPLVVDDYQHWEGRSPNWEDEPIAAILGVPLKRGDQVIGVLDFVESTKGRRFGQHDIWLATLFASQVVIAIENARLYAGRQRRIAELATLNQIGQALSSTLELDALLEMIYRQVNQVMDARNLYIALYDEEKDEVSFPLYYDLGEPVWPPPRRGRSGLTEYIIRTRKPLMFSNVSDEENSERLRQLGVGELFGKPARSWLGVPMVAGGKVVGVIGVQSYTEENLYDEGHLEILSTIANQAAIAIENARLYQRSQELVERISRLYDLSIRINEALGLEETLDLVVRKVIEAADAHSAVINLLDQRGHLESRLGIGADGELLEDEPLPRPDGATMSVYRTGAPLAVNGLEEERSLAPCLRKKGIRSFIGLPLKTRERCIGVLFVRYTEPHPFSEEEIQALSLFANQAAVAIENARLYEETHSRAERLAVVNRIARAASATLHLDDLMETSYQEIARVFSADAFFIALYDEGTNELDFRIRIDEGVREPPQRRPMERSLTGQVISSKKPLLIRDFEKEKEHLSQLARLWGTMEAPASWLGVPMLIGDRVVGVISVQAYRPYAYGEEEQLLLSTIADQVAVAVDNARLFESERRQRELAEALEQAAAVLGGTLETREVLDRILEQVGRVVPNDAANIMLIEGDDEARILRWQGYERFGAEEFVSTGVFNISRTPTLRQMIETGEPLVVPDTAVYPGWVHVPEQEWLRSYAAAPIVVRGKVIGFLNVDSGIPGFFTEAHLEPLRAFASHAAAAIENARLFETERRRAEEMEALAEVSRAVSSTLDLEQVLNTIAAHAVALSHSDEGGIFEFDKAEGMLRVIASYNASPEFVEAVNGVGVRIGEGAVGRAVATGEPAQLVDTEADPDYRFKENAAIDGIRSILAVPMFKGEELLGGIVLWRREPGAFSSRDVALLSALADHAAVAIENARLYEEARRRATEMGVLSDVAVSAASSIRLDEVLDRALTALQDTMHPDDTAILLVEPETNELVIRAWTGFPGGPKLVRRSIGVGVPGWVVQTGQPLLLDDVRQSEHYSACDPDTRSEVCVPLKTGDRVIGALNLESRHLAAFSEDDLHLLSILGSHLANVVENARLFDEARQHAESLSALYQIGKEINTNLELDRILDAICEEAMKATGAATADVALADLEQGFWEIRAVRGLAEDWEGRKLSLDIGVHGRVLRTSEPVIIPDVSQAEYYCLAGDPQIRSELAVPIILENKAIGVVNLESMELSGFDKDDLRFVQALAEQAAIAIRNARLFEAEREQRELAEALEEAAAAVSSTLDPDQVLDRILEQVEQVVEGDAFNIMLIEGNNARLVRWRGYDHLGADEQLAHLAIPIAKYPNLMKMVQSGEPVVIPDTASDSNWVPLDGQEWRRSYVAAPIRVKGRTIGFLSVVSTRPGQFSAADAQQLEAFASHAATAIENARLYQAEQVAREHADTLREVSRAVGSTLELDEVLSLVLRQAKRVLTYDTASILLFNGGQPSMAAVLGYEDEELVKTEIPSRLKNSPILQAMARDLRSVVIPDVRGDERWIWIAGAKHVRSWIGAPLLARGKMIGALMVDSKQPGLYTEADAAVAQALANQVAVAIENARLFTSLAQEKERLELLYRLSRHISESLDVRQVAQRALDDMCAIMGAMRGIAVVREPDSDRLRIVAVSGYGAESVDALDQRLGLHLGNGLIGWVAAQQRPALVDDVTKDEHWMPVSGVDDWVRSALSVPLLSGDEIEGAFSIYSDREAFFNDEHRRLAESIAATVAVAIVNAQLYEQTRRHLQSLTNLNRASQAIASSLDAKEILKQIVDLMGSVVNSDYTSVVLLNEDGEPVLDTEDFRGVPPVSQRIRGSGVTRHVLDSGRPAVVDMIADDGSMTPPLRRPDGELIGANPALVAAGIRSFAALPIQAKGKTLGILFVHSRQPYAFHAQVPLLTTFANQAAAALENAHLYEEVVAANADLEEALRLREELVQNVSHELRTPLALIRGYAELMLSGALGSMTPEQEKALQVMVRRSQDLVSMVNDLLMLKAPHAGLSRREAFDLGDLISETVQELKLEAEEAHIVFKLDFSEDTPMVNGNRESLSRVVSNLLGNAIKFSPDGGTVTVRLRPYSKDEVLLSVSDTGIGIPPDKLERIFERFYQVDGSTTRKFGGAGIGLALVKEIVAGHGGRVWAESEGVPGKGSTFFVVLPAAKEGVEAE